MAVTISTPCPVTESRALPAVTVIRVSRTGTVIRVSRTGTVIRVSRAVTVLGGAGTRAYGGRVTSRGRCVVRVTRGWGCSSWEGRTGVRRRGLA
ncbi:hypothetical protein ABGB17_09170, partial [Sphaerisporangium sp. B11E5]|uniref:hypothetical protein n=1 Tax=Sphaerisporangium sp. B11E5 TaxID=3153563 RepID=UPI00325E6764